MFFTGLFLRFRRMALRVESFFYCLFFTSLYSQEIFGRIFEGYELWCHQNNESGPQLSLRKLSEILLCLGALLQASLLSLACFEFLSYLVAIEVCCQSWKGRAGVQSQGLSFWGGTWLKTHLCKALQKPAASSALELNVYHFSTQLRLIADNSTRNRVICNTLYEIWCIQRLLAIHWQTEHMKQCPYSRRRDQTQIHVFQHSQIFIYKTDFLCSIMNCSWLSDTGMNSGHTEEFERNTALTL